MSPEQVRGQAVDARSDIFALGAVVYELLSGRRAFTGDTAADTMTAILTKDPDDLSRAGLLVPSLPPGPLPRGGLAVLTLVRMCPTRPGASCPGRRPRPPPSRSQTSRLTHAGMWRERAFTATPSRGFDVAASFFRATASIRTVSARSKIAPRSPSGVLRRRSSWTRSSFSCVASPTVNCTRYRSGASGVTAGRWAGRSGMAAPLGAQNGPRGSPVTDEEGDEAMSAGERRGMGREPKPSAR
jgi:serine/threonine protein kinase